MKKVLVILLLGIVSLSTTACGKTNTTNPAEIHTEENLENVSNSDVNPEEIDSETVINVNSDNSIQTSDISTQIREITDSFADIYFNGDKEMAYIWGVNYITSVNAKNIAAKACDENGLDWYYTELGFDGYLGYVEKIYQICNLDFAQVSNAYNKLYNSKKDSNESTGYGDILYIPILTVTPYADILMSNSYKPYSDIELIEKLCHVDSNSKYLVEDGGFDGITSCKAEGWLQTGEFFNTNTQGWICGAATAYKVRFKYNANLYSCIYNIGTAEHSYGYLPVPILDDFNVEFNSANKMFTFTDGDEKYILSVTELVDSGMLVPTRRLYFISQGYSEEEADSKSKVTKKDGIEEYIKYFESDTPETYRNLYREIAKTCESSFFTKEVPFADTDLYKANLNIWNDYFQGFADAATENDFTNDAGTFIKQLEDIASSME